jgi:hypothetical protein
MPVVLLTKIKTRQNHGPDDFLLDFQMSSTLKSFRVLSHDEGCVGGGTRWFNEIEEWS